VTLAAPEDCVFSAVRPLCITSNVKARTSVPVATPTVPIALPNPTPCPGLQTTVDAEVQATAAAEVYTMDAWAELSLGVMSPPSTVTDKEAVTGRFVLRTPLTPSACENAVVALIVFSFVVTATAEESEVIKLNLLVT